MKKTIALISVCALALLSVAAVRTYTLDLKVDNGTDTVAMTLQKGAVTANFVEAYAGSALKFAVPATGVLPTTYGGTGAATPAAAKTALGIQFASVTTAEDGTVTNTFATEFSAAPAVVAIPVAPSADVLTNVLVSVTKSNSVHNLGAHDIVLKVIAIGAP